MFGRRKKHPGSGHIKDNTFGSSNEISFSVLDAKKKSVDSDDERDQGTPLGRISLFTLGKAKKPASTPSKDRLIAMPSDDSGAGKGGTTTPLRDVSGKRNADAPSKPKWEYSQQEVSMRKSKRRRAKAVAISASVLVVLVLVAIGGYFGVRAIQHQMDFIGQLDDQVAIVDTQREALQPFIALVNDAVEKPLEELDASAQTAALDSQCSKLDECTAKLKATRKDIERIQGNLVTPGDKERSNDAMVSINAMLNMIEIGTKVMDECIDYTKDNADAKRMMEMLLEGDAAAREAAELGSGNTQDGMRASIDKSNEAIADFKDASALAATIRDGGKVDGMQLFIDYIALRISAQESAINADNAFLSVNSAQLAAFGEEYNAKEAQAAELIASVNEVYPPQLVKQAFDAWRTGNESIASWRTELQRSLV